MEGGPEATRARGSDGGALVSVPQSSDTLALHSAPPAPGRTSLLAASTMLLTGHAAAVYCLQFNPTGDALASGSFDKSILLWDVYGEVRRFAPLFLVCSVPPPFLHVLSLSIVCVISTLPI